MLLLPTVAMGIGASVATSCVGVNYPTVAFRCNPRQQDNCPDSHFCCSDDPTAQNGDLPDYEGKGIGGSTPIFSGQNNGLGTSGMCVRRGDIQPGSGLLELAAANCPIPCNPSWTGAQIASVCGDRVCCQTVELDPMDCINEGGTFRPATGQDILDGLTDWAPARHITHQSPGGQGCTDFAMGDNDARTDCIRNLTVANQRGFCMQLGGELCPTDPSTGYVDACAILNSGGAPMN